MGWFGTKQQRLDKKLRNACGNGKLPEIERLLTEGADINAKDDEGSSALHYAACRGRLEAAILLIAKKADIRVADNKGKTILMTACEYYHKNIAEMLVQQDCNVTAKENDGATALHHAAERGWESVVQKLLEKGAGVQVKTDNGWTALHNAAACGRFNVVKLLLANGADANALDNQGNKPESLARKHDYHGVADFLRDKTTAAAAVVVKTGWQLTAPDEIVFAAEKAAAGYCLTEIFNFSSRIYIHIARNLKTNAESQTIRFFDEFPDKKILENAYQMLLKQGGTADSAAIYGAVLDKKFLKPE